MTHEIDDLLAEVIRLSRQIEAAPPDDPATARLVERREELRTAAREAALDRRHPASVDAEIERIEHRLAEIEGMLISKGYSEKHIGKAIQDPGAYSHVINTLIGDEHHDEVVDLRARLSELRTWRSEESRP